MFCAFKNGEELFSGHVGHGPISGDNMVSSTGDYVVQADGHELELIKDQFENLPYCKTTRVHKWYGDHAKLIIANIKL